MTRVDGAVIIGRGITAMGFGAEIRAPQSKLKVMLSDRSKVRETSTEHYGTRHRSAIRYCSAVPGSIALIISQDGTLRATTRIGDAVYIWDNLSAFEPNEFTTGSDHIKEQKRMRKKFLSTPDLGE
jgi:hypothetical protein